MPAVLRRRRHPARQLRAGGMPDAGGLVIATDQTAARAYAETLDQDHRGAARRRAVRRPRRLGRGSPSSPPGTSGGWSRCGWSPRASTCRGWRSACTPPARRPRCSSRRRSAGSCGRGGRGETASVFLPSVPMLLELASELEAQRDHVLGKPHRGRRTASTTNCSPTPTGRKDEPGEEEKAFTSLGADAELDQVIFDGSSFGTATFAGSDEEADYLGIPGLLDADQMRALLRQRQEKQLDRTEIQQTPAPPQQVAERLAAADELPSCAANSIPWWRSCTIAPVNRTASSTENSDASAVAHRPRWRAPSSCATASLFCGAGDQPTAGDEPAVNDETGDCWKAVARCRGRVATRGFRTADQMVASASASVTTVAPSSRSRSVCSFA